MQLITQKNIKLQNMMKVFQEIYRQGSISRQTLASKTGISLMTVGKIVDQLVRCDIASEEKKDTTKVGRKGNVVSIVPDRKKIVLIDLEQRDFRLGLLQMDLKLKPDLYQHQYDHNQSYEENLRNAVSSFLREQLEDEMGNTVGVGVCVPGPYYQQGDRVLHSRIPELSSAKLKATLCPFFSDQILYIDEDVRCAAQLNGSLTWMTIFFTLSLVKV